MLLCVFGSMCVNVVISVYIFHRNAKHIDFVYEFCVYIYTLISYKEFTNYAMKVFESFF